MSRRNVEVISCDWCGRDLAEKESWEKIGRYNYTTIVKQWCRHLRR